MFDFFSPVNWNRFLELFSNIQKLRELSFNEIFIIMLLLVQRKIKCFKMSFE